MIMQATTSPLDAAIADRLLDLLGSDDLFRERFRRDPLAALHSIGYESPAPARMTACGAAAAPQPEPFADCKVHELAAKEVIQAARGEIRSMLLRGLAQTTPKLDATLAPTRLVLK